jgi:hypothetical protein
MKPSALLTDVKLVLDMLHRIGEAQGALAKASGADLIRSRGRFLEAPTDTTWRLCLKAARQLADDLERPANPRLDPATREGLEFIEAKKRREPRKAKGVNFDPMRRKT